VEEAKAVELINLLLEEGKFAEVASILFYYHKNKLSSWIILKSELLSAAGNSDRFLSTISTLLEVSTKKTLAESCHLVPSLSSFLCRKKNDY